MNIPVRLYTATASHDISFHQFQAKTGQRIHNKRVAERSGREVPYEQIVKGYELAKGKVVLVDPKELEALEPKRTRTIEIEQFVELSEIDPILWETTYYLGTDESAGARKSYLLLRKAMEETGKVGVGRFVMRTKEYLVTVRPFGSGLALETMYYADEIRDQEEAAGLPGKAAVSPRELQMARQLIETLSAPFDLKKFGDTYRDKVEKLLQKKARGEEIRVRGGARGDRPGSRPDGGAESEPGRRNERPKEGGGAGPGRRRTQGLAEALRSADRSPATRGLNRGQHPSPGRSDCRMRPPWRQPALASQVRGATTGDGSVAAGGAGSNPSNQGADEQGFDAPPVGGLLLAKGHEQADQRLAHLGRRGQRAGPVAVGPDRAGAVELVVDRAGNPDGDPARAADQRSAAGRLDDQVQAVALHRELDDAEVPPAGRPQRLAHRREQPGRAQRGEPDPGPQTEMHRVGSSVGRTRAVGDRPGAPRNGRPAGSRPLATPAGATAGGFWFSTPSFD